LSLWLSSPSLIFALDGAAWKDLCRHRILADPHLAPFVPRASTTPNTRANLLFFLIWTYRRGLRQACVQAQQEEQIAVARSEVHYNGCCSVTPTPQRIC